MRNRQIRDTNVIHCVPMFGGLFRRPWISDSVSFGRIWKDMKIWDSLEQEQITLLGDIKMASFIS
jgi:hypothetical protein